MKKQQKLKKPKKISEFFRESPLNQEDLDLSRDETVIRGNIVL